MKARADLGSQLPAGLPLPALDPDAHGQCVVDRALDAVLVLLGQAGSLPSLVLENDGKLKKGDEVAYFVSRGALSRLRGVCRVGEDEEQTWGSCYAPEGGARALNIKPMPSTKDALRNAVNGYVAAGDDADAVVPISAA